MVPSLPRTRGRGDRRGFEPRHAGALPAPSRPRAEDVWDGTRVECLLVDLSGGLADAARAAPFLAFGAREGRVGSLAWTGEDAHGAWLAAATGIPIAHDPSTPDRRLPRMAELARRWDPIPRVPLMALAADALGISLASITGPCLALEPELEAALRAQFEAAGWTGQPIVALATVPEGEGPIDRECTPASIAASMDRLREVHDLFPVDLDTVPLEHLAGAIRLADTVVTGASAALALAECVGTPALALLGPTDPLLGISATGSFPLQPPECFCPRLPCGSGSPTRGPPLQPGAGLPCPPAGGCLSRLESEAIAAATSRFVGQIWHGRPVR